MRTHKKSILRNLLLCWIFGSTYCTIEVLFRGYSHWTMLCLGALCGFLIGQENEIIPWEMSLIKQGVIGAILVTCLEFATGLIVNVWLGWHIWDYSNMPFNILGQICLPFSIAWIGLSIICIIVDDYLRYIIFDEQMPKYYLFTKKER